MCSIFVHIRLTLLKIKSSFLRLLNNNSKLRVKTRLLIVCFCCCWFFFPFFFLSKRRDRVILGGNFCTGIRNTYTYVSYVKKKTIFAYIIKVVKFALETWISGELQQLLSTTITVVYLIDLTLTNGRWKNKINVRIMRKITWFFFSLFPAR